MPTYSAEKPQLLELDEKSLKKFVSGKLCFPNGEVANELLVMGVKLQSISQVDTPEESSQYFFVPDFKMQHSGMLELVRQLPNMPSITVACIGFMGRVVYDKVASMIQIRPGGSSLRGVDVDNPIDEALELIRSLLVQAKFKHLKVEIDWNVY